MDPEVQESKHVEDSGLAGAGRPHNHAELAFLDVEGHASDRMNFDATHVVGLTDVPELNKCHVTRPIPAVPSHQSLSTLCPGPRWMAGGAG